MPQDPWTVYNTDWYRAGDVYLLNRQKRGSPVRDTWNKSNSWDQKDLSEVEKFTQDLEKKDFDEKAVKVEY